MTLWDGNRITPRSKGRGISTLSRHSSNPICPEQHFSKNEISTTPRSYVDK